jgi:hypothetical protein
MLDVRTRSHAILLDMAARGLATDLLSPINTAQRRWPIALGDVAAILHHRILLSGGTLRQVRMSAGSGLRQIGTGAALRQVGTSAGLRAAGELTAELLALLDPRTVLAELLARRRIAVGDASAMDGIVLPVIIVGVAVAIEMALSRC